LQTTSNTASAQCIAACFNSAIVAASMVRSPAANAVAHERARVLHIADRRAPRAADALLRATAGRHAHDEHGGAPSMITPSPVADTGAAVKNLRITGSAVLLQNFREVRRFHFCSVSVAV
jgi:hypothetical protein